jgi:nucleotide-binding universal stress UspA family protein
MSRSNPILVAANEETTANLNETINQAAQLATTNQTHVEILYVFTDGMDDYRELTENLGFDNRPGAEPDPDNVSARQETVRQIKSELREQGITVQVKGRIGELSDEILAVADTVDAGQIIVGGKKRSATGKLVFGSAAQSVLMNASAPVTFLRSDTDSEKKQKLFN